LLAAAAMAVTSYRGRWLAARRTCLARPEAHLSRQLRGVARASGDMGRYFPLEVETPEGTSFTVEARLKDSVGTLKGLIEMKTGNAVEQQLLKLRARILDDAITLSELGVLEMEKFTVEWVTDVVMADGEEEGEQVLDESMIKLQAKCEERPGKPRNVSIIISRDARIKELKLKVLDRMSEEIRQLGPRSYGLFLIPEDYTTKATAALTGLTYLTEDERLPETKTIKECGLTGDEEITLVNICFLDAY